MSKMVLRVLLLRELSADRGLACQNDELGLTGLSASGTTSKVTRIVTCHTPIVYPVGCPTTYSQDIRDGIASQTQVKDKRDVSREWIGRNTGWKIRGRVKRVEAMVQVIIQNDRGVPPG